MGNVIFNNELLLKAINQLKANKSIIEVSNLDISQLNKNKIIQLKNKKYSFNHIILSVGKNFNNNSLIKQFNLTTSHHAYVGFFDHKKNHYQKAYEIFTSLGPLAVLPSPSEQKKSSTFIFSTKNKMT